MSLTLNNAIPFVPENTIDPASGLNEALNVLDPLVQAYALTAGDNAPPASPNEGDCHIVGSSPGGAWAGKANQLARFENGAWTFRPACIVACEANESLNVRFPSGWKVFT